MPRYEWEWEDGTEGAKQERIRGRQAQKKAWENWKGVFENAPREVFDRESTAWLNTCELKSVGFFLISRTLQLSTLHGTPIGRVEMEPKCKTKFFYIQNNAVFRGRLPSKWFDNQAIPVALTREVP